MKKADASKKRTDVSKTGNSTENAKKRNWAMILYPTKEQLSEMGVQYDGADGYGSLPDDWRQVLQLSGLKYAISPLHDKDESADGSGRIKKPHYHVIMVYGNTTTYRNVKAFTDKLSAPAPITMECVTGYYKYFTHKDNPDKHQYAESDIVVGGGFDIRDYLPELTRGAKEVIKKKLHGKIEAENITEYCDFMNYVLCNMNDDDYEVASGNTVFFNSFIQSKRNKQRDEDKAAMDMLKRKIKTGKYVNVDTGEVLMLV